MIFVSVVDIEFIIYIHNLDYCCGKRIFYSPFNAMSVEKRGLFLNLFRIIISQ